MCVQQPVHKNQSMGVFSDLLTQLERRELLAEIVHLNTQYNSFPTALCFWLRADEHHVETMRTTRIH